MQSTLLRRRWARFRSWFQVGMQGGGRAGLVVGLLLVVLFLSDLGDLLHRVPGEPDPGTTNLVNVWVPWLAHLLPLTYALGAGLDFFPAALHPFLIYQVILQGDHARFLRLAIRRQVLRGAGGAALGLAIWLGIARILNVPLASWSLALAVSWLPAAAAAPLWAGRVALMPAPLRGWVRLLRPVVLMAGLIALLGAAASGWAGAAWIMPLLNLALLGSGAFVLERALGTSSPWVVLEGERVRARLGKAPSRRVELLRQWRQRGRNRLARGLASLPLPHWCRGGWAYVWRALLVWVGEHPLQPIGIGVIGIVGLVGLPPPGALPGDATSGVGFLGAIPGAEGVWAYLGGLLAPLGLTLARLPELGWYSEVRRQEVRFQLPDPGRYLFWNGALPGAVAVVGTVLAVPGAAAILGISPSQPALGLLKLWAAGHAVLAVFCVLHEPIWSRVPPPPTVNPFQPAGSAGMARTISLAFTLLPGLATTLGTAWFRSVPAGLLVGIASVPVVIATLWRNLRTEWGG